VVIGEYEKPLLKEEQIRIYETIELAVYILDLVLKTNSFVLIYNKQLTEDNLFKIWLKIILWVFLIDWSLALYYSILNFPLEKYIDLL